MAITVHGISIPSGTHRDGHSAFLSATRIITVITDGLITRILTGIHMIMGTGRVTLPGTVPMAILPIGTDFTTDTITAITRMHIITEITTIRITAREG